MAKFCQLGGKSHPERLKYTYPTCITPLTAKEKGPLPMFKSCSGSIKLDFDSSIDITLIYRSSPNDVGVILS